MKSLIRITDLTKDDINNIFTIADNIHNEEYASYLKGKTIIMFFPSSSIRTRTTFEKGIYLLGGQSILFEPEVLDKKEKICDVAGYLNNWADGLIIRYPDIHMIDNINLSSSVPVINAMTKSIHPCEILTDMYSLHKMGRDISGDKYLYVGPAGNIGYSWQEMSEVMGFELTQCCPDKYRMKNVSWSDSLKECIVGKDIICTDSLPKDVVKDFEQFQINSGIMSTANDGAVLNPCPPFYRGEEVSQEVIESKYFVGYNFKKYLLEVQMAVMVYLM